MAKTAQPGAGTAVPVTPELLPGRPVDLRSAVRMGLVGGATAIFLVAVNIVFKFSTTNFIDGLSLGHAILAAVPLLFGYVAGRAPKVIEGFAPTPPGSRNLVGGIIAGVLTGLLLGLFVAIAGNVDLSRVLANLFPARLRVLTLGQSLPVAFLVLLVGGTGLGAAGGALHLIHEGWRRPLLSAITWVVVFAMLEGLIEQILERGAYYVADFLYQPRGGLSVPGGIVVLALFFAIHATLRRRRSVITETMDRLPEATQKRIRLGVAALVVLVLLFLPTFLGRFYTEVVNVAGIFLLMALGLNIVVGLAGLLDLGYVAFFAVGAYTMAVLTSPTSPAFAPELTFWLALPFVVLAAAVAGLIVGTPVLRMRGDYLAIVTLGFGEITRLVVLSDWAKPTFGGALGVRQVPDIAVGTFALNQPQTFYFATLAFLILAVYMSYALQDSRMGRAWMAIREDESVAEAMGVNVVAAKLWAFIIGAIMAGFGGALFATKVGSVFPHSFEVLVSITVLVVIIMGGLASVPGVILGAFVLVALPEILREFQEFRFLIYGTLLIYMMLRRPEGFIPSRRRAQELHEEEVAQDVWLRAQEQRQAEAG